MRMETFRAEHLKKMGLTPGNEYLLPFQVQDLRYLERSPYARTIFADDGTVLVCGGVTPYWEGRGEAWALVNRGRRKDFLGMHRMAKKFIRDCPIRRVEASVECDSVNGHRWCKALGFTLEAKRLKAFLPGGKDGALYARVK